MRALLILLGLTVAAGWATAQEADKPFQYKGNVYGLANLGACVHGYGFYGGGGGGEVLVFKGLSVGGEGSYNTFSDGWAMGFLSGQVGYHFGNRTRRVGMDSFVSGGMGGTFFTSGNRTEPSVNFGGGATYWFKQNIGLRFEGRLMTVGTSDGVIVFRIGASFR